MLLVAPYTAENGYAVADTGIARLNYSTSKFTLTVAVPTLLDCTVVATKSASAVVLSLAPWMVAVIMLISALL